MPAPRDTAGSPVVQTDKGLILVVDDDPELRQTLAEFLADLGYCALVASEGEEALAILRSPENPLPQLILLDRRMPGLDAKGFLEAQGKDPDLRSIPVLEMTAECWPDLDKQDTLQKPLRLDQLAVAIRRRLRAERLKPRSTRRPPRR